MDIYYLKLNLSNNYELPSYQYLQFPKEIYYSNSKTTLQ